MNDMLQPAKTHYLGNMTAMGQIAKGAGGYLTLAEVTGLTRLIDIKN